MGVYFISYGQFYMEKVDLQTKGNFFQPLHGSERNHSHFKLVWRKTLSILCLGANLQFLQSYDLRVFL